MTDGSPVEVHRFATTPHVGAHADAPAHFRPGGATIDAVSLEPYIGPCQVVHCQSGPPRPVVTLAEIRAALARTPGPVAPRLLIRTYRVFPATWVDDFPGLDPEVPAWLSDEGGVLVGVDTASLDPRTSTAMAAHRAAADHGIAILENLCLDIVPEGRYELVALPLRLVGLDASPVRAVLR